MELMADEPMLDVSGSEEYDSGSLKSECGSDLDEVSIGRPEHPIFRPEIDVENPKFKLGMRFSSKSLLREVITAHKVNG